MNQPLIYGELTLDRLLIELVVAILCGALLGIQRGGGRRQVLLRETTLVCLSAALMMVVGELIVVSTGEHSISSPVGFAGMAVIAATLFAAASTIRGRPDQGGIGRGALIWVSACVGLMIGAGRPLLGLLVTGTVILTLTLIRALEGQVAGKPRPLLLKVSLRQDDPEIRNRIREIVEREGIRPDSLRSEQIPNGWRITVTAPAEPVEMRHLLTAIWTLPGVTEVEH